MVTVAATAASSSAKKTSTTKKKSSKKSSYQGQVTVAAAGKSAARSYAGAKKDGSITTPKTRELVSPRSRNYRGHLAHG